MTRRAPPLYLELRQTLAEELAMGKYPVGSRFPTEQELCERFGYARHTVREALRGLQEAGLLVRQARTGTIVLATRPPEPYANRINSLDELWQYAKETRFESRHEGVVILREALAETLGRSSGERWLRMAGYRRHVGDTLPLCWSEIFVAEPYIGIRSKLNHTHSPVYALLSEQYEISINQVERQIRAVAMPSDVASVLGARPSSPALLERRTFIGSDAEVFEITLSIYPGDRFAHTTHLVREATTVSDPKHVTKGSSDVLPVHRI